MDMKRNVNFIECAKHIVIENHLKPDFSVTKLYSIMSVNKTTLFRNIKKHCNQKPKEFIEDIKLEKAMLLLNKKSKIKEVAYESGFQDYRCFSRRFKKKYGYNPSTYKKKALLNQQ